MVAIAFRDGTQSDAQMRDRALAKLTVAGGILAIAETDLGIQGFALATEETPPGKARRAHLSLLAVDPGYQFHGLGRSLVAHLTQALVMDGFTEATLGVLEENRAARKIYEDAGWHATGNGFFEDSGRPCIYYLRGLEQPLHRQ